jgi:hypothetical protein
VLEWSTFLLQCFNGKISTFVHDQTEPQHPSKFGSTVENMVEPTEMAGNEFWGHIKARNEANAFLAHPEAPGAIKSMAPRFFFKA